MCESERSKFPLLVTRARQKGVGIFTHQLQYSLVGRSVVISVQVQANDNITTEGGERSRANG